VGNEWEIKKGKRIRVSTYSSDFEGIVEKYTTWVEATNYLYLTDAEEIRFYVRPDSCDPQFYKRKARKVKIPVDKINHYEFLDD